MSAPDDAQPDVAPPAPAATLASSSIDEPALLIWFVALLAMLAALLARAIEPALPGVWLSIDHVITAVKLGGALASQLFAVVSSAVVIGLVLSTVRTHNLPAYYRAYSVGAGVLVILAVMVASARKLPQGATLVLAAVSAVLAIMGARLSVRFVNLRGSALVVGFLGIGGVVRIVSILLAELTTLTGSDVALLGARVAATIASLFEMFSMITAAIWYARRSRAERTRRRWPRWPTLALALLCAVLGIIVALKGRDADVSGGHVFVARALTELLHHPEPYVPWFVRAFFELSAWCLTLVTLLLCPRTRLMSAVVALALVAGITLEVPLCAMALTIAALALVHHPGPDLREELEPGA